MANLLTWSSYELKGTKESFANWISCISPTDTPFGSMVKKVSVGNTQFNWQTDKLKDAAYNHQIEGSDAAPYTKRSPTTKQAGYTQIFRATGAISDTVENQDYWGRVSETKYQLSKIGAELKRDVEYTFLSFQNAYEGDFDEAFNTSEARLTGGFLGQLGPLSDFDPNNSEQNFFAVNNVTVDSIKDMVSNLFTLGSNANVIMYHPSQSAFFSSWMETAPAGGVRQRLFNNLDGRINTWVKKYRDAFGVEYILVPNRFCQKNVIYFFNPINFRQMMLREPRHFELDKTGSATKHMIEMEVGLRHANPQISGAIVIKDDAAVPTFDKGYTVNLPAGGILTITELNGVVGTWTSDSSNITFGDAAPSDANVIQIDSSAQVGDLYSVFFAPTNPIQVGKYWGNATIAVNIVAANDPNITTRMAHVSTTPVDDTPKAPEPSVSVPKTTKAQTPKRSRKTAQKLVQEASEASANVVGG